jgi:hypothetical protein
MTGHSVAPNSCLFMADCTRSTTGTVSSHSQVRSTPTAALWRPRRTDTTGHFLPFASAKQWSLERLVHSEIRRTRGERWLRPLQTFSNVCGPSRSTIRTSRSKLIPPAEFNE